MSPEPELPPVKLALSLRATSLFDRPDWAKWRFAGFWRRSLAAAIDGIAAAIPALAAALALGVIAHVIVAASQPDAWNSFLEEEQQHARDNAATGAAISGFCVSYLGYLWVGTALGGTIGKRLLNLRVVRAIDGKAPGFRFAAVRIVVSIVSLLCFALGYLWLVWDDNKQSWHDRATKTLVVTR